MPALERPSVSVCTANHNHADIVVAALGDALGQTEPALEILVLDDGSTDESPRVLSELAAREPRLQVELAERNRGVAAAMGRLLESARGDYILWLAADDRVDTNLLAEATGLLARHPGAGICTVLARVIDERGHQTGELRSGAPLPNPGYLSPTEVSNRLAQGQSSWMMSAGALWHREALIDVGGFRPELGPFTDLQTGLALALRHGACFVPLLLASWRRMEGGYATSTAANPEALRRSVHAGVRFMREGHVARFPPCLRALMARDRLMMPQLVQAEQRFLRRRDRWTARVAGLPGGRAIGWLANRLSRAAMVVEVMRVRRTHGAGAHRGVVELWRERNRD